MKLMTTLALIWFTALTAQAATQAPDFTVTTLGGEVVATPPPGHHINIKAPMELEDPTLQQHLKASTAKEQRVSFKVSGTQARELTLRLYLCDDANTYCERHSVNVKWTGKGASPDKTAAPADKSAKIDSKATPGPAKPGKGENGFIVNDPKTALAQALAKHQPLLIDFYGIWCPPCNMLDEEVFSSTAFKKAATNFVKLKLDADAEVSWPLKARYRVSGYPTVVLATAEGEEISRVIGFRPLPEFIASVNKAWEARKQSYTQLREKADAGDVKACGTIGLGHLQRGEYELAYKYLEKSRENREQLYDASIGVLEAGTDKDKLLKVLEEAVHEYPDTVDSIERRMKLAELYEAAHETEKYKVQLGAVILTANLLAAQPEKLVGHDALAADLLSTAADATEKFGTPEQARLAWKRAAEEYRAQLNHLALAKAGAERGYNIELAYCLWKSGNIAAAETLYQRLELKYPREFTFFFGHARMNLELKKPQQARELAAKAYEFSYGDNRLRAGQLLAQAYVAEGNKPEALAVVLKTLSSSALPEDTNNRTHRYVAKLKDLEKSLAQGL